MEILNAIRMYLSTLGVTAKLNLLQQRSDFAHMPTWRQQET
jgi:hypothetical protein